MKPLFNTVYLFIFILSMFSCGNQTPKTVESNIDSSKLFVVQLPTKGVIQKTFDTIKLGRIIAGESVESNFIVTNSNDEPIVINSIITGCGCVAAKYDAKPIHKGESRVVKVIYNSKGQYGTQMKVIELVTHNYDAARIFISCFVDEK